MEKHDLKLSKPRGALKTDVLKIYDQLKDTNVEDYMRRFGKEGFPREWADLNQRQQDLDTMLMHLAINSILKLRIFMKCFLRRIKEMERCG